MINERIANIECGCGMKFQVLNVEGNNWDEVATAKAYDDHMKVCDLNKVVVE